MPPQASWCDLVLEGGGAKGIALVGAITALDRHGYQFRRVAGTSAGAIVAALITAGMSADELLATMRAVDYKRFKDPTTLTRFGTIGLLLSVLFTKGAYRGDYMQLWLGETLAMLGVRTFGDLKITEDWAMSLPPERRYKLVVVASDISHGRMVRLPWDYVKYDLDPDEQLVAEAVRGSMSLPFFYPPAKIKHSLVVDGGLLSNYPIDLFDSSHDWPTFGIKLSARQHVNTVTNPVRNLLGYGKAILATATNGHDRMYIEDRCTQKRTISIDTGKISATDYDISPGELDYLYENGVTAADNFLKTWNFEAYKQLCVDANRTY